MASETPCLTGNETTVRWRQPAVKSEEVEEERHEPSSPFKTSLALVSTSLAMMVEWLFFLERFAACKFQKNESGGR